MRAKSFKPMSFLFAALSLLLITSCEVDSDSDGISTSNIVGVWTVESSTVDVLIEGVSVLDYVMNELNLTEEQAQAFIDEYMGDIDDMADMSGTFEIKDDGTYIANFVGEDPDEGDWRLSSDSKTLYIDEGDVEDEMIFDVITLTASRLIVESTRIEPLDGTTDEMEMTMRINFTK